jgi:PAS domain S-box-containing protein
MFASEIFEKLPVEIVVFDQDYQLRYANFLARCTAFKFKNREHLELRTEEEILREWGKRNLQEAQKSNQPHTWEDIARVESGDPQLIYRSVEPIRVGAETVYLGYAFDITSVRRNEVDLDQGRTIFQAFLDNMEALVFIVSTDGVIGYLSENVATFFGGKVEKRIGKKIDAIGGPFKENGPRWLSEVEEYSGEKFSRKVVWQSKNGSKVYKLDMEFVKNPLDGSSIFGSLVDITKKENYEENLRESINEANELIALKSNFINIVSHEMRTPLAGMRTSLELLAPRIEKLKDERATKHLNRIAAQVERMSEMMRDVIDMNRLGIKAGELELVEVDLIAKLQEVIRYLIDIKYAKRIVELDSKVDRLRFLTDEKAFNTIFTNLIDNALKFSLKL